MGQRDVCSIFYIILFYGCIAFEVGIYWNAFDQYKLLFYCIRFVLSIGQRNKVNQIHLKWKEIREIFLFVSSVILVIASFFLIIVNIRPISDSGPNMSHLVPQLVAFFLVVTSPGLEVFFFSFYFITLLKLWNAEVFQINFIKFTYICTSLGTQDIFVPSECDLLKKQSKKPHKIKFIVISSHFISISIQE